MPDFNDPMAPDAFDPGPPSCPPPQPPNPSTGADKNVAYTALVDEHFPDEPGHDDNSLHSRIRAFLLAVKSL